MFITMCVPWESNPQPFALLTQCSTTEPQEHQDIESRLLRTLSNRSRGCQTLINLHRVASSRTHLVLQPYWLIDVDENIPLGIEIWYRTTRHFSILDGIEAIRSVPKKYRTRYPALRFTKYMDWLYIQNANVSFSDLCTL